MAQQDKTDWYWNGMLAGAINNLYYDLINVDVVPAPYSTYHRNSSFFLKTRLAYSISENRAEGDETSGFEVMDIKIIWDESCDNTSGTVFVLGKSGQTKAIFKAEISQHSGTQIGCVGEFERCTEDDILEDTECGNRKLFTTDFVKGERVKKGNTVASSSRILTPKTGSTATEVQGEGTGIQINRYIAGKSVGFFSDANVENGYAKFTTHSDNANTAIKTGSYLLVYQSRNMDGDGLAGQVRMITGISNEGWIMLDEAWLGLTVSSDDDKETGGGVSYAIFEERGEVVGFSNNKNIEIIYDPENCGHMSVYDQSGGYGGAKGKIIGVAEASNKIFVLTKNGYVHYNKDTGGYNKFFINDDMFAGVDKIAIASYRDMILAFGRKHIALGVPDEQNNYWTMYDQSQTIGLWSKYSFNEYDGDLLFVSNDKRLLALTINSSGRYGLAFEDFGERLNGKLATLIPGDEVYIGSDNNNLRVFCNISGDPYYVKQRGHADVSESFNASSTHIYKFDTLFRVWSEDHISGQLLKGATEGIYYGEGGIYVRDTVEMDGTYIHNGTTKGKGTPFTTTISAYMIENENNGLDNHPLLFHLAKLNRLITTLGPGIYTDTSKIKVTTYSKGIGYTYHFPINGDGNDWLGLVTSYYLEEELSEEEQEKLQCKLSTLQDGQEKYQPNCPEGDVMRQYVVQNSPRCESYSEMITEDHGICINDKLYEIAPTMPLTTNLGENQQYATQIKIELIGGQGDVICFGGRLAELFIAPLFMTGPDGDYQLEPKTNC